MVFFMSDGSRREGSIVRLTLARTFWLLTSVLVVGAAGPVLSAAADAVGAVNADQLWRPFSNDPRNMLEGKLASAKEIKMRVKNWQADWLRA